MFVSNRPGGCGGGDIYATRLHHRRGWEPPENLGCTINSAAEEAGPVRVSHALYFSSTRTGNSDIYMSPVFGPCIAAPAPVAELNSPFEDARPHVRSRRSRDRVRLQSPGRIRTARRLDGDSDTRVGILVAAREPRPSRQLARGRDAPLAVLGREHPLFRIDPWRIPRRLHEHAQALTCLPVGRGRPSSPPRAALTHPASKHRDPPQTQRASEEPLVERSRAAARAPRRRQRARCRSSSSCVRASLSFHVDRSGEDEEELRSVTELLI